MQELTKSPAWQALQAHFESMKNTTMRELFESDGQRFSRFSLQACGLFFDFSKNRINAQTMDLLIQLLQQRGFDEQQARLFGGCDINNTECRPALHTALRNLTGEPALAHGRDVMPVVEQTRQKMKDFTHAVYFGERTGFSGKVFTDIVNIGIGGSFLGARVVCDALKPFVKTGLKLHFISDVDGKEIIDELDGLNAETTLFIVSSKTFTTQETMTNAHTAREWVSTVFCNDKAWQSHFIAVTADSERAIEFGIRQDLIFEIWDWVGGRYSLWSAIGLPIMLYAGIEQFEALLAGAHEMDQHFLQAPLDKNMPVVMALLSIWYINFFGAQAWAILPYDKHLGRLPGHLQQLEMESNGKQVSRDGDAIDYRTAPVIWGQSGTNGQHAFYQLIHQGTQLIPADFIAPMRSPYQVGDHHTILLTHFFAQTEALMKGKTEEEVKVELKAEGLADDEIEKLLPHKVFEGNRPSNTIVFPELDAHTLGALLACYEHKVFVQGVIWGINSFDQWGVELGKVLAKNILPELKGESAPSGHDASTAGLIDYFKKHNG